MIPDTDVRPMASDPRTYADEPLPVATQPSGVWCDICQSSTATVRMAGRDRCQRCAEAFIRRIKVGRAFGGDR